MVLRKKFIVPQPDSVVLGATLGAFTTYETKLPTSREYHRTLEHVSSRSILDASRRTGVMFPRYDSQRMVVVGL